MLSLFILILHILLAPALTVASLSPRAWDSCAFAARGQWQRKADKDTSPPISYRKCYIDDRQDCSLRPGGEHMYSYRWQPAASSSAACGQFTPFDARGFMDLLSGVKIAFVGDSLMRNMFQSLMCLLHDLVEESGKLGPSGFVRGGKDGTAALRLRFAQVSTGGQPQQNTLLQALPPRGRSRTGSGGFYREFETSLSDLIRALEYADHGAVSAGRASRGRGKATTPTTTALLPGTGGCALVRDSAEPEMFPRPEHHQRHPYTGQVLARATCPSAAAARALQRLLLEPRPPRFFVGNRTFYTQVVREAQDYSYEWPVYAATSTTAASTTQRPTELAFALSNFLVNPWLGWTNGHGAPPVEALPDFSTLESGLEDALRWAPDVLVLSTGTWWIHTRLDPRAGIAALADQLRTRFSGAVLWRGPDLGHFSDPAATASSCNTLYHSPATTPWHRPFPESTRRLDETASHIVHAMDEAVFGNGGGGGGGGAIKTLEECVYRLNVTSMSGMRPDGHPGNFGNGDCLHWCLPGVPDSWTELMYNLLRVAGGARNLKGMSECAVPRT